MKDNIVIKNKKASHNYQFIDKYTAGIILVGTEVKSIRNNNANFVDSYCTFIDGELWLGGLHISQYKFGESHIEKCNRKLLLTKRELNKLSSTVKETGLTIVPTKLFVNDEGFIKVEIALAKGLKLFDKRDVLKEKDIKREINRESKNIY